MQQLATCRALAAIIEKAVEALSLAPDILFKEARCSELVQDLNLAILYL